MEIVAKLRINKKKTTSSFSLDENSFQAPDNLPSIKILFKKEVIHTVYRPFNNYSTMYRVFLTNKQLIVFDKTEKEFRQKYGNNYEQVTIIKEENNIDSVCEKLVKQYNAELVKDYHIKKKLGWKYWSNELKQQISTNISIALKRYKKTKEHVENMSKSRMGKAKFKGKKHSAHSKMLISFGKRGQDSIKGKRWMHNPYSGKERRGYELEEGMIWGRSPEAADHILKARSLRGKR